MLGLLFSDTSQPIYGAGGGMRGYMRPKSVYEYNNLYRK